MSGGIYLIQNDDQLTEMVERPYDSEVLLQELLERYPNLIVIDQNLNSRAKPWLLVKRTVSISSEEIYAQQWSLNHLFLDPQAVPTLVEVRERIDLQTRRELIGQMFDYAANVALYWPVESILAQFEANCRLANRDPEQVFEEFLGADADEEAFWQQVKTNLQAGRIRLVFVADQIPSELQRVVEFLNKQMDPAEVLAIEIKQYVSPQETHKTLVSKIIGQTAEAQQRKSRTTRERRQWDLHSFLLEYELRYGEFESEMIQLIYEWIEQQNSEIEVHWGTGETQGGFAAKFNPSGKQTYELFFVGINGRLQISSDHYSVLPPFNQEQEWQELRNKFTSIGLALPNDRHQKRFPDFPLSTLVDASALKPVLKTFDWVVQKITAN